MNKKTSRNKPSQPAQKTLTAAVHAAALAQGSEAADLTDIHTDTPLVVENVIDAPAPEAIPATDSDAKKPSQKAEKPGKPVTFSLTLPAGDAQRFDVLRHAHQAEGGKLKKSTVLRAALVALSELDHERAAQIIAGLQAPGDDKPKAGKAKSKK